MMDESPGAWERASVFYLDAEYGLEENYRRQVYALGVTVYQGIHHGLFTVLEWPKDETDEPTADVTRIYFGTSRDGSHFDLRWIYSGNMLIELDEVGRPRRNSTQDFQSMRPGAQFVTHDGHHWLYYESCPNQHERRYLGGCEVRLARFRQDGFAGISSIGDGWGHLVTRPFVVQGTRLELNLELLGSSGEAFVAVLDEGGKSIPGYTCKESVGVASGQHSMVNWRGKTGVTDLKGRKVRLKIVLKSARLYAMQFQ